MTDYDDQWEAERAAVEERMTFGRCPDTMPVAGNLLQCELSAGHKLRNHTDHYVTLRWGNSMLLVRQGANG